MYFVTKTEDTHYVVQKNRAELSSHPDLPIELPYYHLPGLAFLDEIVPDALKLLHNLRG